MTDDELPRLKNGLLDFALLGREIYHGTVYLNISPASIQNLLERIAKADRFRQPEKKDEKA